ncbi:MULTISPECIES: SseB family protein [Paracoccus]|uniref:Type III secretion system (T3SS) SseB-like protein n=1 Tax=Paracoccus versutus TaxID=34007 RepID=A0A3D9XW80_PARVE|nr:MULTISPECIES: SseB family protein [Paracoccus]REF72492.1 type III secretion system (T3SS) SseB-like protein [Paracoccus versutus]WGR55554.1 SseB family protein [Paracoccus versutus]
MTPLDELCQVPFHEADAPARSRILSRLADTELFVALLAEPADDRAELRLFDLPEGRFALACDREERLAGFVGGPVAYLALPGRVLAAALAEEGRGLLVNPGHGSQLMLDAGVLAWLVRALEARPSMAPDEAARRLGAPSPQAVALLAEPLAQRLGDMAGLVGRLALVAAEWRDGRQGHALILSGVEPAHQAAVAKALAELLAFLPELPGGVDIGFAEPDLPAGALILEPPPPPPAPEPVRRDPSAPPRLR